LDSELVVSDDPSSITEEVDTVPKQAGRKIASEMETDNVQFSL
jgi:hypothetical protein